MAPSEIERQAKELLNSILYPRDLNVFTNSERVRCIICDGLVRLEHASLVYDESGEFYGWECETHI